MNKRNTSEDFAAEIELGGDENERRALCVNLDCIIRIRHLLIAETEMVEYNIDLEKELQAENERNAQALSDKIIGKIKMRMKSIDQSIWRMKYEKAVQ